VDGGNRREALARLTSADGKIAQVKKAFPNNQAAGVLTLRINFLRDPTGDAPGMFRNMFDNAVRRINRNNREATLEAYSELQNLQQINPNYSGMARAIYDAEIALGLREPPPDPRAIAESNRLTREANAIVLRSETAQFDLALEMVNRALRLNPYNQEAGRVKSRLQDRGGSVVNVLPSALDEQYRRAQQLFNSQNYFEALAIVDRLLQTPEGKNFPSLQDLKRRIESQI
jgi:tetratricopeptide (TPR) repeat protein